MTYEWVEGMREISGMGGDYEAACRAMLVGGMKWLDEHPEVEPEFHGFRNVYGVIAEDNADAEALSKAIVAAAGDHGCTGAMHQAVVSHCLFIRANGWAKYVEEMSAHSKRCSTS